MVLVGLAAASTTCWLLLLVLLGRYNAPFCPHPVSTLVANVTVSTAIVGDSFEICMNALNFKKKNKCKNKICDGVIVAVFAFYKQLSHLTKDEH